MLEDWLEEDIETLGIDTMEDLLVVDKMRKLVAMPTVMDLEDEEEDREDREWVPTVRVMRRIRMFISGMRMKIVLVEQPTSPVVQSEPAAPTTVRKRKAKVSTKKAPLPQKGKTNPDPGTFSILFRC